jgi:putative transcriptional regulator
LDREFFQALLEAAREARRRRRALLDRVLRGGVRRPAAGDSDSALDVRGVRALTKLSQARFAELLSIEVSTLRNWEQGRRVPTGPARALLRAIRCNPVEVIKALNGTHS